MIPKKLESRATSDFVAMEPSTPGGVAHREVPVEAGVLGAGEIGSHQSAFGERGKLGTLNDANHFELAGMAGSFSNTKTVSDSRTIRKEAARHGFVNHCHLR